MKNYVIWSIEHNAWWAPNSYGYTSLLQDAGVYAQTEAAKIVQQANIVSFNECMIPVESVTDGIPDIYVPDAYRAVDR